MASVATESIVVDHHLQAATAEAGSLVQRIRTNNDDLALEGLDISELVSSVVNRQHILPTSLNYGVGSTKEKTPSTAAEEGGGYKVEIVAVAETVDLAAGEESSDEEEVVELEFERAAEKVHTHTPFCPKCNSQITKVVLRRKIPKKKKVVEAPSTAVDDDERVDLVGCLSCFSVFTSSGKKLRPFRNLWGKKKPAVEMPVPSSDGGDGTIEDPSCEAEEETAPRPKKPAVIGDGLRDAVIIPIGGDGTETTTAAYPIQSSGGLRKLDILKCIVYGGLAESIASLSVVSSAAASDVSTPKVVAIGLATLISSIAVFAPNLVELKNEHPPSGPHSSATAGGRYKQVLGHSKENFLVHFTLAMISFLAFGLVPPFVYGFAFRVSDDKPYKLIAVAVAACLCVGGLASAKAYLARCTRFGEYVKKVSYYVSLAIAGSGVGYAAGEMVGLLLERLGLFGPDGSSGTIVPSMIMGPWMSTFR